MTSSRCAVLVFAKAPVAGYAKTRLAPALGHDGAARLAERLLQHAVEQACAADVGPVTLFCAPDSTHHAFERLAQAQGVRLAEQCGGDLGMRMATALIGALRLNRTAVLIGTDAPKLDATYVRGAAHALLAHDAVFAPTFDGGYALVGLHRPANEAPRLFEGIAWSTPRVMTQTRERLATLRLTHVELAPLADIDEPADLQHVPPAWIL
jgi:rSAM/selenodomain-associated transferase 1